MNKNNKKELIYYLVILLVLIIMAICNNLFWKIGKQEKENTFFQNNITYLETGNIVYNVPFEEEWLD